MPAVRHPHSDLVIPMRSRLVITYASVNCTRMMTAIEREGGVACGVGRGGKGEDAAQKGRDGE